MGRMSHPTITGARADLITVSVEPFRSTDSRGREVEIHYYERDGIYVSSYGYVLRKDGERSKQGITRLDLHAEIPQNVAQLMGSLIRPFDAACVRFLIHGTARKRAAASVSRREDGGA